jgi:DNA-binding CsgD family transcriptional regulator
MSTEAQLGYWLDVTASLLAHPLRDFPHEDLLLHLLDAFEVTSVSWEYHEPPVVHRFAHAAHDDARFTEQTLDDFHSAEVLERHPLLTWFAASRSTAPQSVGRIPASVVGCRDRAWFEENLAPFEVEQQVSIPYRLAGPHHGAFVLARSRDDFTDEEMRLAAQLQRLFAGIDLQVRTQRQGAQAVLAGRAPQVGLTATELAVLQLLAEGLTAQAIGHRLASSPRTVQKHLEHLYRKLGVSDRLRAVQVGAELGLAVEARATVACLRGA